MEVVEHTLETDLASFLARPMFCLLAQQSAEGPRVSPLWFLWEDRSIWIVATRSQSYIDRIEADPRTALAVVDFEPETGRVEHVGMRGRSTIEPFQPGRATRLLARYLGDDTGAWPARFRDLAADKQAMIRFDPETVVARDQSYRLP